MSDPFESAVFSIKRASKHARDFNALATEFMKSEPYTSRIDFNADTGLRELKVKLIREFPEDLRGLASDAIKNIRDSLDQAMSAATYVVTGARKRRAHFPFGESTDNLEDSLSRRKAPQCRDIPEELFAAIRFIRPYPHEGDEFWLKSLQKVSGPHKHSVSLTLGPSTPVPFIQQIELKTGDGHTTTINYPDWDSTEEEAVVATFDGEGAPVFDVPFQIAFDHPDLRRAPASILIDRWGTRADWIIQGLRKTAENIVAERGA